jgi:hypothetical protein
MSGRRKGARSYTMASAGRRDQERAVVDVAVDRAQVGERTGKADGEQEAEQHLGAGDEGAQLLEQLAVLALQPFFDLFVLKVFPKPLLDHFVGGHVVLPPRFVGTLREARICPVYVEWVGRVGPRRTQSHGPDDHGMLDPPLVRSTPWIRGENQAFRPLLMDTRQRRDDGGDSRAD